MEIIGLYYRWGCCSAGLFLCVIYSSVKKIRRKL